MEITVFESTDKFLAGAIENALREAQIPLIIVGMADSGLAMSQLVTIKVPEEYKDQANELITSIKGS